MYKVLVNDEGTKENMYWERTFRTKFFARRAIIAMAKIDVQRAIMPDFPMFCWFGRKRNRKTEGKLFMSCGNITWKIEKA